MTRKKRHSLTHTPNLSVVHVSLNQEDALAELPALCSGDTSAPQASGIGSNAKVDAGARQVPKAVVFAGSLPPDQIKQVQDAIAAVAPEVKAITITKDDVNASGGPPDPAVIAKILKEKLQAAF